MRSEGGLRKRGGAGLGDGKARNEGHFGRGLKVGIGVIAGADGEKTVERAMGRESVAAISISRRQKAGFSGQNGIGWFASRDFFEVRLEPLKAGMEFFNIFHGFLFDNIELQYCTVLHLAVG